MIARAMAASSCSPESHARLRSLVSVAGHVEGRVQFDEEGEPALLLFPCACCHTSLAVEATRDALAGTAAALVRDQESAGVLAGLVEQLQRVRL